MKISAGLCVIIISVILILYNIIYIYIYYLCILCILVSISHIVSKFSCEICFILFARHLELRQFLHMETGPHPRCRGVQIFNLVHPIVNNYPLVN